MGFFFFFFLPQLLNLACDGEGQPLLRCACSRLSFKLKDGALTPEQTALRRPLPLPLSPACTHTHT